MDGTSPIGSALYLAALLLALLALYRPLWRVRHRGRGGIVCRAGKVEGDEIVAGELRLPASAAGARVRDGEAVTLVGLEVGASWELLRVKRGVWPELRWLRFSPALAGLLLLLGLTFGDRIASPPVGLARQVEIAERFALHRGASGPPSRSTTEPARQALLELRRRLRPLQRALPPPAPGDWLAEHREAGQTLEQYLASDAVHARGKRRVIYLQPIGGLSVAQRRLLALTADFMMRYLCLETRIAKPIPLEVIPAEARRRHPSHGGEQLLSGYLLARVLHPRLPDDAAAYVGLTASDLWPGRGWNFVFGEASLRDRVGVWSLHRMGDLAREFDRTLLRTIKTATHETGHMLSMRHCTAHACNLGGANSLEESDRGPLTLCAECLPKLIWATGCDPAARYRSLASFFRERGLGEQAQSYDRLLHAIAP